jgi:hypothetical protein
MKKPRPVARAAADDVMAGLVPAIHAAPLRIIFGFALRGSAWMPGT